MANREFDGVKINVEFEETANRQQISSGDNLNTLFGKIKKWFADLKMVAFSGSYTDLLNKPTIPTVNNATLTIQKNGTKVQTFTANQGTNATANITVPTKASDIGAVATTKVLTTKEQVTANTDTSNIASAVVVGELINNLGSKANGTFAVLTGTTHTAAGQQTSQNYPSGFNQNNCAVAGVMVKLGQNWYSGNYNSGYTHINTQVILSSQVGIIPASGWTNCQYKIVLYKYA